MTSYDVASIICQALAIGAVSTRPARLQSLRSDVIMLQPYGTVLGADAVIKVPFFLGTGGSGMYEIGVTADDTSTEWVMLETTWDNGADEDGSGVGYATVNISSFSVGPDR